MGAPTPLAKPLLPEHPPLLCRQQNGERTVYVSPQLPAGMDREDGNWSLSDFTLTKQLYKGKASTLYMATDKPSGEVIALKTYSKRRLSDLNWYQVEREIRLHGQLRHPNVIQLYAAFEDATHVFMVCEFAQGGDLYEDLKRAGGQLKERMVAGEVLPPFMAALAHMHSRCIIHRDIKPENILLTADRTVKVADFGLSINWGEERPVTRAGTLDYMSPEVLQCPEKSRPEENKEKVELGYSDAVDVWAAGILAYELLVGKPPFERETREETYQCIQKAEPVLPDGLSQPARDFILTALAKSARKRPSMEELLRHPWIQQHSRRPSVPSPARTSEFHVTLDQLVAAAQQDKQRHSLHGAQSVRDFSALLSATSAALQPAFSIASALLSTTSTFDPNATIRPTTAQTRLGRAAAGRPDTPGSAALVEASPEELEAALPAPAGFPAPIAEEVLGEEEALGMEMEQTPASPAARPTGFGSTASSLQLQQSRAGTVHDAGTFITAFSTSSIEANASPSFARSAAAMRLLNSSLQQPSMQGTAAAGDAQSAFLELYKSMAPAASSAGLERTGSSHTPRSQPLGRNASGSRPGAASMARTGGGYNVQDAALPLLQQQAQQAQQQEPGGGAPSGLARLPSLHKAAPQPSPLAESVAKRAPPDADRAVRDASSAAAPATLATPSAALPEPVKPVPTSAAAVAAEQQHAALDPIPEQASEASTLVGSSKTELAGHLVAAAHKKQQAAAAQPAASAQPAAAPASEARIPAVHSSASQLYGSSADSEHRRWRQHSLDAESSRASSQLTAQDRMRQAEQRHVEKLRARMLKESSRLGSPGRQIGGTGYATGIAKSASSLLSRLLGRKPAATSALADASVQRSHSSGSAASARAAVEKSGSSGSAASSSVGGSPKAARSHHSQPAAIHLSVRAGGSPGHSSSSSQQAAGGSHSSHSSSSSLVQHRLQQRSTNSAARGSQAVSHTSATVLLRSPVSGRPVPGRAVPVSRFPASSSSSPPPATAQRAALPSPSGSSQTDASSEGVQSRSNSKTVRFAALQQAAHGSHADTQDSGDLIRAFHAPTTSPSQSFTSARSSLPSLSAHSGTAGSPHATRKGSPAASRMGSQLAAMHSRTYGDRTLGSSRLHSSAHSRPGKVVSTPGDAGRAASKGALPREQRSSGEGDGVGDAVQRSAASWSHPASAAGSKASPLRKSSATAARLSMYRQMLDAEERTSLGSMHSPPPAC